MFDRKLRVAVLVSVTASVLAACGSAGLPSVTPPANRAPSITGTPATAVAAGASYSFSPAASDPDGDSLTFAIINKPSWATFSGSSGTLSGTTQSGNYVGIQISVSDGAMTRFLPAFSIVVTGPTSGTGTAALSWTAPTQYTDGSSLPAGQLIGYRVYYGTSAAALSPYHDVTGAQVTTYEARQLGLGDHCFAVTAVTSMNVESELSPVRCKRI